MSKETKVATSYSGVSFLGLLTILFVGLKLTGHIAWSWWWVLSPLWIPWAIALVIILVLLIVVAIQKTSKRKG